MRRHPLVSLFLSALLLQADPPKLDALFPAGGARGETVQVKAVGKFGSWPPGVWTDHPGISIEANETKGLLHFSIAQEAKLRPALVRLFDVNGSSTARTFVISNQEEIREIESNNHKGRAQDLNVTRQETIVNGILKKDDSDFFRVYLKRGQTLKARAEAYSLGSMVDPFLSLLDSEGHEVALASDSHNLDPRLAYEAKSCGPYYLQLFGVAHPAATFIGYSGSDSAVYRLGLSLGEPKEKDLAAVHKEYELPDENGSRRILFPSSVAGFLSNRGEVDSYVFEARKRQKCQLRVDAQSLGLITDPVMTLHRPGGTLLKEADDGKGTRDAAYLSSSIPEDGNYTVRIWDRFRRGGKTFRYRFTISNPKPELVTGANKESIVLETNGTASLKLSFTRKNGNKNSLRMKTVPPLPNGVTLEDANASAKATQTDLTFRASPDAKPANLTFRIRMIEIDENNATVKSFAKHSLLTRTKKGDYLVNETPWLHITVKTAPPPKKKEEGKEEKLR